METITLKEISERIRKNKEKYKDVLESFEERAKAKRNPKKRLRPRNPVE